MTLVLYMDKSYIYYIYLSLIHILTLSRNFVNPIAQVSQQLNSVIMAMAGASRIFELLDLSLIHI